MLLMLPMVPVLFSLHLHDNTVCQNDCYYALQETRYEKKTASAPQNIKTIADTQIQKPDVRGFHIDLSEMW